MTDSDPRFHQGNFEGTVLQDLKYIKEMLAMKVDRSEFVPVKALAYGFAGIILTGVIGALLAQVVRALSL